MKKYSHDLCWELGLTFCSTQLSTQVPHHTSKNVAMWASMSYLGLWTWDPMWSGKSQLPCSQQLKDCIDWPQVTWDLGLGTPCEPTLSSVFSFYGPWEYKHGMLGAQGLFPSWTMKLSHVRDHFPWSHFHGSISWQCISKVLGPLTRCNPNVDQKKWPFTKKWMCWFLCYICQKGHFLEFSSCLTFSPSSSPLSS